MSQLKHSTNFTVTPCNNYTITYTVWVDYGTNIFICDILIDASIIRLLPWIYHYGNIQQNHAI